MEREGHTGFQMTDIKKLKKVASIGVGRELFQSEFTRGVGAWTAYGPLLGGNVVRFGYVILINLYVKSISLNFVVNRNQDFPGLLLSLLALCYGGFLILCFLLRPYRDKPISFAEAFLTMCFAIICQAAGLMQWFGGNRNAHLFETQLTLLELTVNAMAYIIIIFTVLFFGLNCIEKLRVLMRDSDVRKKRLLMDLVAQSTIEKAYLEWKFTKLGYNVAHDTVLASQLGLSFGNEAMLQHAQKQAAAASGGTAAASGGPGSLSSTTAGAASTAGAGGLVVVVVVVCVFFFFCKFVNL